MSIHSSRAAALAAALLPLLAQATPLSLELALDLAVQRSEATRAARAGVVSAGEAARAAGQFPDPLLRVGVDNLPVTGADRLNTTRDSMTMKRIGISQEYVSQAKRAARQGAADAAVARELVQTEAAIANTRLQTALAYLDAYYAGEALKLSVLAEHHAREDFEAARARLAASTGTSHEVLALGGARGVAADESDEVRQLEQTAKVTLQRWIGVEPTELAAPTAAPVPAEEAFVASVPAVVAIERDVELARKAATAMASERKPNWTWEVSYGQRTGYSDMVSFGVSIPLPIAPSQRQDRETAAKLALVDKTEAELAEVTRQMTAEYRALASDVQRLRQRIERYSTSVVQPAEQRTAVTLAAYRSNAIPLTTLFEARHVEVETRKKLLTLQRDLAKTLAQLTFRPLTTGAVR